MTYDSTAKLIFLNNTYASFLRPKSPYPTFLPACFYVIIRANITNITHDNSNSIRKKHFLRRKKRT